MDRIRILVAIAVVLSMTGSGVLVLGFSNDPSDYPLPAHTLFAVEQWQEPGGSGDTEFASHGPAWNTGLVPSNGDDVQFTSNFASCDWNIVRSLGFLALNAYNAYIYQEVNLSVNNAILDRGGGPWDQWRVYNNAYFTVRGSFYAYAGTITDNNMNLIMSGDGYTLSVVPILRTLHITGNITTATGIPLRSQYGYLIDAGRSLMIANEMSIRPAVGQVNVSISTYAPGAYNQSEPAITFTANHTGVGAVTFLTKLKPFTSYMTVVDGNQSDHFTTNATGWYEYTYSGPWSLHTFSFRVSLSSVSGIDWTFPAVTDSGTLKTMDASYPPPASTATVVPSTSIQESDVGQKNSQSEGMPYVWRDYRTYLSFNTSALPDTATVLSAELRLKTRDVNKDDNYNILVYGSNFSTLTASDWNSSTDYQGVLMSSSGATVNTWYHLPISTDAINLTGQSQFMMRSSQEGTPPSWPTYEFMRFWNMTSSYVPVLVVKIQVLGTILAIQRDSGAWFNSSVFPEVQDWNLTYDILHFTFSTIPTTRNATIFKQSSTWALQGVAPACNYTDNTTQARFEDLFDSITYQVWFTAPKAYAYSLIHIALYNAFTGEGLFWEQMRVVVSDGATYDNSTASTVSNPDLLLNSQQNFTFTVTDYFGNLVTNYSITTSAAQMNVYIPVPIYSYKFYNQNPTFALLRIHYNMTGAPYSEFIPPYDTVGRYLKTGTYRFNITFYNATGYAGNTYTWVRTIPSSTFPGAGFVILEGDTISEAIAAANGARAIVQVLADLVTPDVLWIGQNVPQVPAYLMTISNDVIFNNRYLISAETTETHSGFMLNYSDPVPADIATSTVVIDDFRFVGNVSTHLFINSTSTTVYTSATLPATVSTNGTALTVWTNRTVSSTRDMTFRFTRAFTYQFFPATKQYQADIVFQNQGSLNWRNVTLFLPFMNNSRVDNRSVVVFDDNNSMALVEGTNYVLSSTGVHMWFANVNASLWRGFMLTYTTFNGTMSPPRIVVNQLGDGTTVTQVWNKDTFYYCTAAWTNTFNEGYKGPVYIVLELSMSVDPGSVIVLSESNTVITDAVVNGNTIMIPSVNVPTGTRVSYTILFQTKIPSSPMDITFAGVPILFLLFAIVIASFSIGMMLLATSRKSEAQRQLGIMMITISVVALAIAGLFMLYFMGTT